MTDFHLRASIAAALLFLLLAICCQPFFASGVLASAARAQEAGSGPDPTDSGRPGAAAAAPPAGAIVQVVVVSPGANSRSARIGSAHLATIAFALSHLGHSIRTQFGEVRIELVPRDDDGNTDGGTRIGEELLKLDKVVAVLGPVNSDSTRALLAVLDGAQYPLPVLSALSTAPILTRSDGRVRRSPNFFRLTFHDTDRMRRYASYLERLEKPVSHFALLYENSVYGSGLLDSLQAFLDARKVTPLRWDEFGGSTDVGARGVSSRPTVAARKLAREADGFVLLGGSETALRLSKQIETMRRTKGGYQLFFVGQDMRLVHGAPVDAVTIGDPVLDPARAPTWELRRDWRDLLASFRAYSHLPESEFLPTAYEAVLTLRAALSRALAHETALPDDLRSVREALRTGLETGSFESLEPWRKIRFAEGDLTPSLEAPIYRIRRQSAREDLAATPQWIELSTRDDGMEFGTGWVIVRATLKGTRGYGGGRNLHLDVDGKEVPLDFVEGRAEAKLWKLLPGKHRIRTYPIPSSPSELDIEVDRPWSLGVAAVLAFVGWGLVAARQPREQRARLAAMVGGVIAGVTLTVLSFLGRELSSAVPVVSLSPIPPLNAALIGFISGVAGPGLLLGLLHRVSAVFAGDEPGKSPSSQQRQAAETSA